MRRYTLTYLFTLLLLLAGLSAFNLIVDPYAATDWVSIDGVNARKSRAHTDGRRVHVSHQILKRPEKSIIIGSSRVVDGFIQTTSEWPEGLYNAGIRGSNAYELAHVAALAKQKNDLRCIVVGMDVSEFSSGDKFKPAFLISHFQDGIRWRSLSRMMLSPNTFMRSVQTLQDNVTGGSAKPPFRDVYEPGEQRQRFLESVENLSEEHQRLKMSRERIDYLFTALDALAAEGVQVIGYIHPLHAWYEEPSFRAGQDSNSLQLREILADKFEALSENYEPTSPCTPEADAILWDFSGFQWPSTTALPTEDQTQSHKIFHEPAHYLPWLGRLITNTLQGKPSSHPSFGFKLFPSNVDATAKQIEARRKTYLETREGQMLSQILNKPVAQLPPINIQDLTPTEWKELEKRLE